MRNNPVNFNDPTGHMETGPCSAHGEDCGGGGSEPEKSLEEIIGLNKNKDLACTENSCTVDTGVCPLGQTCWDIPGYWDLDPKNADYHSTVINIYYFVVQITKDRYGNSFLSFGGSTSIGGISWISGSIGDPFDNKIPTFTETAAFLTGPSVNLTGSELGGVGYTLSLGNLLNNLILDSNASFSAWEGGIHVTYPSLTPTGTWGFPIP